MLRALACVLILVPGVGALSFEDSSGDVVLDGAGAPHDDPETDIIAAGVENESVDAFEVWIEKGAWPAAGSLAACVGASDTRMTFDFDGMSYAVYIGDGASLFVLNRAISQYYLIDELDWVEQGERRVAIVPKALVTGLDGLSVRSGMAIADVHARARGIAACEPVATGTNVQAVDYAPDAGPHPGTFEFHEGPGAFGEITVSTPSPIRSSNGGPDVFVYPLTVENHGPRREIFVSAEDAPESWNVRAPARVELQERSTSTIHVILATPSAHQHGEAEAFNMVFADSQGSTIGTYPLGVRFLEIPQLAGHHARAFVHSGYTQFTTLGGKPATWTGWLNTLLETEGDTDNDLYSMEQDELGWRILMDPRLVIGLDFDVEGTGQVNFALGDDLGGRYILQAAILHCRPGADEGLYPGAYGCDRGGWIEMAASTDHSFETEPTTPTQVTMDLAISQYADLQPYIPGSNLMLDIRAARGETAVNHVEGPYIRTKDAYLDLPLIEFSDPFDASLVENERIGLMASGSQVVVNAGDTVWISYAVSSGAPSDIAIDVVGHHANWARVHPGTAARISGDYRFAISVSPPAGSAPGEYADLIIVVEDEADATRGNLARLRADVVAEPVDEATDGSDLSKGLHDAPDVAWPWLMAAVLAVLVVRRSQSP